MTHGGDDVVRCHGDVLYACAAVVVDVLLNLATTTSGRRFVDWHLDRFFIVGNDDRPQSRVLRVHRLIVHRPETMKHQRSLVPALDDVTISSVISVNDNENKQK